MIGCPNIFRVDKKLSLPYRPYHTHHEEQKLKAGQVVGVNVTATDTQGNNAISSVPLSIG